MRSVGAGDVDERWGWVGYEESEYVEEWGGGCLRGLAVRGRSCRWVVVVVIWYVLERGVWCTALYGRGVDTGMIRLVLYSGLPSRGTHATVRLVR